MGKYLDFYNKHIETGRLPVCGLCLSFDTSDEFALFIPDWDTSMIGSLFYWGYNGAPMYPSQLTDREKREFTPLRQTIVLLMAAMNKEL